MNMVILLNSDYTTLGLVDWKKAVKLWSKGKIEIIKTSKKIIRNFENTIELHLPEVIRLLKFVKDLWKIKTSFSKKALIIRDNFTCQYCGKNLRKDKLSIDHIVPKSKGGKTTFDNCVLSCIPCNFQKNDKSCIELKMIPKNKPYTPTITQFIKMWIERSGLDKTLKELEIKCLSEQKMR